MKKLTLVFSFVLLGVGAFAHNSILENSKSQKVMTTEYSTMFDRCYVRYCVETENGLSCTDWKEVPCPQQ